MERKVLLICCAVGILGLLSAATGFAAEATRIKVSDACVYPRSPAMSLGLTAAVCLMLAQITINISTGCVCCRRGSHQANANWRLACLCFIILWFTFVISFLLLLMGAAINDQHDEENFCVSRPGVFFAAASVLSLASVVLGLIYYITLTSMTNGGAGAPHHGGGIAMGKPQFPPQNVQPQAVLYVVIKI